MALNVIITIDTEIMYHLLDRQDILNSIDISVYGRSKDSQYGLNYIIEIMNKYHIKASFFVEPLFTLVGGNEPLEEIIRIIQSKGHEVQLHLHPEWLGKIPDPPVAPHGKYVKDYILDEQTSLISFGLARLRECGAASVNCFRAGHYGASLDTLRALSINGIFFDTSHNTCYLQDCCEMNTGSDLLQPLLIRGVWEFPINYFIDWPNHKRHTQITACSFLEIRNVLRWAHLNKWFCLVIVFHSFELLNRKKEVQGQVCPDKWMMNRFHSLCRFLDENRGEFRTIGFSDIDCEMIPCVKNIKPICSNIFRTGLRISEQILRKMQS